MIYTNAKITRTGLAFLAITILTAGMCSDAVAKAGKGRWHARNSNYQSRAQLVPQQPAQRETTRYYGGPKSPMWRGPVQN
jgi:hypothetical protein